MATEKNITMKQFNGTDYDTLYPKTIASQIPDVYSKSYIDSKLKNNSKIQTGSYVGTGTYGANNPCTLTFDFVPYLIIIRAQSYRTMIYINGAGAVIYAETYPSGMLGVFHYLKEGTEITTVNNITSWYNDKLSQSSGALNQLNNEGETYKWVAFS